jgi:hypothetical protein
MGAQAFERILRHPRLSASAPEGLLGRAFVLETPIDDPGDDRRNVAKLWELAGLEDSAPPAEKGFSMLTAAIKKIQMKTAATARKAERLKTQAKTKRLSKHKKARKKG